MRGDTVTTQAPVALLAEALVALDDTDPGILGNDLALDDAEATRLAARMLTYPRLAAALDIGTAWLAVVDALPEGNTFDRLERNGGQWSASEFDTGGELHFEDADTPADALRALAAALRERAK